jgi:hypothetical protein
MADLTVNLDFTPIDLEGNPILGRTLAKEVSEQLCTSVGSSNALAKYLAGKELFETGKYVFTNIDSPETQQMIAYFKNMCETFQGWNNQIKGQILKQFIQ